MFLSLFFVVAVIGADLNLFEGRKLFWEQLIASPSCAVAKKVTPPIASKTARHYKRVVLQQSCRPTKPSSRDKCQEELVREQICRRRPASRAH
jgi:hypothetical protein